MEISKHRSKKISSIVVLFLIWVLSSCATTGVHSKEKSLESKSETFREAERHYNAGDYELALDLFIKAEKSEPTNWFTYNRIGWTYLYLLKYQDAIFQFNKSKALEERWGTYVGLGKSYFESGNYEDADKAFFKAVKLAESEYDKNQIKVSMTNCYVNQGNYQKAFEILGPKPYLGVSVKNTKGGIEIIKVVKGSPANLSGLLPGDILTKFNGKKLENIDHKEFIKEILGKQRFGSEAIVQIKRNEIHQEKIVSIGITPNLTKTYVDQKQKNNNKLVNTISVRWAVIIGISTYHDSQIPSLRYASRDAQSFYDWAVSPVGGKYAPSRVKLLLNNDATLLNIKKTIFEWLSSALNEDMVTIYFAGHGSPESPDSSNNLFLLTYDTQYQSLATTAFPMWDIETALKRYIKAKKVIVIADACHSGGVGQSFEIARRSNRGIKVNRISSGMQNLSQVGDGICVISASSENQFSREGQHWGGGHGVFTFFLLKGLMGDADYNNNNSVNLGELTSYLSEQVRRETKNTQSPIVSGRYDPALTIGH